MWKNFEVCEIVILPLLKLGFGAKGVVTQMVGWLFFHHILLNKFQRIEGLLNKLIATNSFRGCGLQK
jgi:hypothetical protein